MKQAIVISHPKNSSLDWITQLLISIRTSYPIMITNHEGWQIDGIRLAWEATDYDEIFFLNDTMVVKDNSIWDIAFKHFAGKSVTCAEKFQMYLAKYRREIVEQIPFPRVTNRRDDVIHGEDIWNHKYMEKDPDYISLDPMTDVNPDIESNFEFKYGRKNMVIENRYFKKWKSQWNISMIQ